MYLAESSQYSSQTQTILDPTAHGQIGYNCVFSLSQFCQWVVVHAGARTTARRLRLFATLGMAPVRQRARLQKQDVPGSSGQGVRVQETCTPNKGSFCESEAKRDLTNGVQPSQVATKLGVSKSTVYKRDVGLRAWLKERTGATHVGGELQGTT